ncbi:rhodanese-like domain-containing protein [Azospirillum soli]|uniref:rhodanese-like domain-containing protein n=1 Tax=Azospirillum soli TaxID=1304799 RepID=UPI001AE362BB|nr:rhodanese-like domain-containing protein [Azospirillum soli]MBP2314307.1 rhodanese-related sulfurtransferase [Azospirillum soli]
MSLDQALRHQIAFYENKLEYETDSWDLYIALQEGTDIVIVDARSAEAYATEHIPGAISFPHRTITAETAAALNRDRLYVTYCDGIGCNASTKSAVKLARLGFRVKELLGGLDWWKRDGYATEGKEARDGTRVACGCAG